MKSFNIWLATLLLLPLLALAQIPEVLPSLTPVPEIVSKLATIESKIPDVKELAPWLLGGLVVLIELIARFFPTKSPKSILYAIAWVLNGAGGIMIKLGKLFDVVAQNVKDKKEEPKPNV
jgi:hypothetical protein